MEPAAIPQNCKRLTGRRAAFALLALLSLSAHGDHGEGTLKAIQLAENESWFRGLIRKYRTYPRLDRAFRQMQAGNLDKARSELEDLVKIDPQDRRIRLVYLELLGRKERYAEMIEQADVLLELDPASVDARIYRGRASRHLGKIDDAIADFEAVAESAVASPEQRRHALLNVADLMIGQRRYQGALDALDRLDGESSDFHYHFSRGTTLDALGRYAAAAESHRLALEAAEAVDDRRDTLLALGEVAIKMADLDTARRHFEAAYALDSAHLPSAKAMVEVTYAQQNYRETETWARKVAEMEPTLANREFLANTLLMAGEPLQALDEFKGLLSDLDAPADVARIQTAIGNVYVALDLPESAEQAFAEAARLQPGLDSLTALAYAQHRAGKVREAIRTLEKTLEEKTPPETYLTLGYWHLGVGDAREALPYFRRAAALADSVATRESALRQKVHVHIGLGQYAHAARALKSLEDIGRLRREDAGLFETLADKSLAEGDVNAAVRYYRRSLDLEDAFHVQHRLATALARQGDLQQAEKILERLLARRDLPARQRPELLKTLGYLYAQLGLPEQAAEALQQSVAAGASEAGLHQDIGFTLGALGRWRESIEHFRKAYELEPSFQSAIYLGRSYQKLNKPGLAIHYLREALEINGRMSREQRIQLLNELGSLYAETKAYDQAVSVWQTSLQLQPDAGLSVRLAMVQRLMGRNEEAKATLEAVDVELLDAELQHDRLQVLALIEAARENWSGAIAYLGQADKIRETADNAYTLGIYHRRLGRLPEAVDHFERAVRLDPANSQYALELAYAYKASGVARAAVSLFETVAEREPENVQVLKELAYVEMQAPDNDRATYWFSKAIDARRAQVAQTAEEQAAIDAEVHNLRRQVQSINNLWDIDLYQSFRSNSGQVGRTQGTVAGGVIPSQGGIQLALQPPVIGFRDERIFQIFTRFLWSNELDDIAIDEETFQGGVGFRYKPFKTNNLYVGAERLFKIGELSQDNWLLRASYDWSMGTEWKPGPRYRNYSLVYGDFGYFTEDSGILAFYGELRQGITINVTDGLVMTPHVVLDGRYQSTDPSVFSYFEGGGGVSFKYSFNDTAYEAYRSRAELLVQYKADIVNAANTWVVTLGIGF